MKIEFTANNRTVWLSRSMEISYVEDMRQEAPGWEVEYLEASGA